jgi:hypothetical protein
VANFFLKSQILSILGLMVFVATTELCHGRAKAAINNTYISECDSFLIKLYFQKQQGDK